MNFSSVTHPWVTNEFPKRYPTLGNSQYSIERRYARMNTRNVKYRKRYMPVEEFDNLLGNHSSFPVVNPNSKARCIECGGQRELDHLCG